MEITEDEKIISEAPWGAVTYSMYGYGDEIEGLYLNCENQFFEPEENRWVDIDLVENYFHTPRRLDDIRELNRLRKLAVV